MRHTDMETDVSLPRGIKLPKYGFRVQIQVDFVQNAVLSSPCHVAFLSWTFSEKKEHFFLLNIMGRTSVF
jgi:hypothetical protein